jgi:hypothetical protein
MNNPFAELINYFKFKLYDTCRNCNSLGTIEILDTR